MSNPADPSKRQIAFWIDAEDLEAIQKIASESGRTQSQTFRAAIKAYVGNDETKNEIDALHEASIAIDRALAFATAKKSAASQSEDAAMPIWA